MPRGQAWTNNVYDIIFRLSIVFDSQTISVITGVDQRTVEITLAPRQENMLIFI